MSLRLSQSKFAFAVAQLIIYAIALNYEVTLGDTYPGKHTHSESGKHSKGLAIDINLFKDNKYLTNTSDHAELGIYWKSLGGTWGGDFTHPDGNHYEW